MVNRSRRLSVRLSASCLPRGGPSFQPTDSCRVFAFWWSSPTASLLPTGGGHMRGTAFVSSGRIRAAIFALALLDLPGCDFFGLVDDDDSALRILALDALVEAGGTQGIRTENRTGRNIFFNPCPRFFERQIGGEWTELPETRPEACPDHLDELPPGVNSGFVTFGSRHLLGVPCAMAPRGGPGLRPSVRRRRDLRDRHDGTGRRASSGSARTSYTRKGRGLDWRTTRRTAPENRFMIRPTMWRRMGPGRSVAPTTGS